MKTKLAAGKQDRSNVIVLSARRRRNENKSLQTSDFGSGWYHNAAIEQALKTRPST